MDRKDQDASVLYMDLVTSSQIIRLVAALLFVLGLMGGLHLALRYINKDKLPKAQGDKRLSIQESLPLDQRRRLVLVRRDDTEHLLIIGQNTEAVVEANIQSTIKNSQQDTKL